MYLKSQNSFLAAVYLRLSKDDGDKMESDSIRNQRSLIRDFAKQHSDITLVKEYVDDGFSGTNFERPDFQKMMEDARNHKINCIIVKDLSRLGRNYIETGRYLSKKYKSCIQTKWKQGVSTGGRIPFGYKKAENKQWEIDEEAAKIVRLIFELALKDYNTAMIANELNERGLPTPGKFRIQRNEEIAWNRKVTDEEWLWDTRIVWMVLRNYAYTGALVQGKTSRIRVGGSETRRTKKHQQFITENHHKGIVTHEEFELAQLVITDQKQKGFARDAGFSLKGKIRCGNCGLKMMYNYGTVPVVYCAHTAAAGKMSTCDKTRYPASRIESIVLAALRKQLGIFQNMARILEESEEKNKMNLPTMQRDMERELEKLKAERIRQYEAYAEGVVDRESYLRNKKELNEKIEKVQTKYEQIQAVTTAEDDLMKDVKTVEKNAEEVNILKRMTRSIAETFVEEITIYDSEKIEVKFVFDDLLVDMANRIEKKKEGIA